MSDHDIDAMLNVPADKLALAACYLNVGEWPTSLPERLQKRYGNQAVRQEILRQIGHRAFLKAWNENKFYRGKGHRLVK